MAERPLRSDGLDPADPLQLEDPLAHAEELDDAWDEGYAAAETDRRWRVVGLILAGISGGIVGAGAVLVLLGLANG